MKIIKLLSVLILALVLLNCTNEKKQKEVNVNKKITENVENISVAPSLFERLGKEEGIASIVDGIFEVHMQNPVVNRVFLPLKKNPEHLAQAKKNIRDFLSSGTGGKAIYSGKDLPSAHKGMKITEKEFLSAIDDIMLVLNNHKIDEQSKKDMLYTLYSLKDLVLNK
jgi:hemoglobin